MTKEYAVSFRYDEDTEDMLQEIVYYIQTSAEGLGLGLVMNRSDAIRYAIESTAIRIRQERKEQEASDE